MLIILINCDQKVSTKFDSFCKYANGQYLPGSDYTPSLHHYDYLKKSENDKTKEKFWLRDETKKSFMSELDGVRNYLTKISSKKL